MKQVLLIAIVFFTVQGNAQQNDTLFRRIKSLDSLTFGAFNKRDIKTFEKYFDKSLEFYHDQGGLTGYAHTIDFLKETAKPGNDLKRELVEGSLQVYPIPGYGAMEIGSHRFCHTENSSLNCAVFQFVHVWQYLNNEWKITRVISYGHIAANNN